MKIVCNSLLSVCIMFYIACGNEHPKSTITKTNNTVKWKNGIAFINDKPQFISGEKLDDPCLMVNEITIKKYRQQKEKIIKGGEIVWGKNKLLISDSKVDDPWAPIITSQKIMIYKIKNNKMYLSDDGKQWSRIYLKIEKDKIPIPIDRHVSPISMVIHLKTKWFEGYYNIFGVGD